MAEHSPSGSRPWFRQVSQLALLGDGQLDHHAQTLRREGEECPCESALTPRSATHTHKIGCPRQGRARQRRRVVYRSWGARGLSGRPLSIPPCQAVRRCWRGAGRRLAREAASRASPLTRRASPSGRRDVVGAYRRSNAGCRNASRSKVPPVQGKDRVSRENSYIAASTSVDGPVASSRAGNLQKCKPEGCPSVTTSAAPHTRRWEGETR